ncbi:DUF433 domain-containing protein [Aquisphaera insulae]|uniref:DUF433 domain-containing protein n=1 Tax=Aquisphaera insulae TaxID=2712864 RepID=UPI0013EC5029
MGTTEIQSHISNAVQDSLPAVDRVRIVRTPGVCGGRPRIDGHRITVEDVAISHERLGMSPDEIASAHPGISLADVFAALAYYHGNRESIDAEIAEGERLVREMMASYGPGPLDESSPHRASHAKNDPVPPR